MIFLTNGHGWPSEFTRAKQIAQILGCKVDTPIERWDETVIAVKRIIDPKISLRLDNLYLDYIDDTDWVVNAKKHPRAKLIALTDLHKAALEKEVDNEIVVIPEHSCNFERLKRTRKEIKAVGYVGSPQCFDINPDLLGRTLNAIGLKFYFMPCVGSKTTREDVVKFYQSIDIQVAFRLPLNDVRNPNYRNPLKIFNAGSFGIPTVAYPEISYSLCAGSYFLDAIDFESLVDRCWRLAGDEELYRFYSDRVLEWSKQFDVENIARLYAKLSPREMFLIDENVAEFRKGA